MFSDLVHRLVRVTTAGRRVLAEGPDFEAVDAARRLLGPYDMWIETISR